MLVDVYLASQRGNMWTNVEKPALIRKGMEIEYVVGK